MAAKVKLTSRVRCQFKLQFAFIVLFTLLLIHVSSANQNFTANPWLSKFSKATAVLDIPSKSQNKTLYFGKVTITSAQIDFRITLYKTAATDDILLSVDGESSRLDVTTLGVYDGSVKEPCCGYKAVVKVTSEGIDAIIDTDNGTYIVEPWSRFEQTEQQSNDVLNETIKDVTNVSFAELPVNKELDCILYTAQDVLNNNTRTDAATAGNEFGHIMDVYSNTRVRRSIGNTECAIHIVADDAFYRQAGNSDVRTTLAEMMYFVREADVIYRGTDFNGDGSGDNIGFYVTKMSIFTNSSEHLMAETTTVLDYLNAFSKYNFDEFCLAVAFTSREYANGVIGLAWVANSNEYGSPGGICQKRVSIGGEIFSLNTGLVTTHNSGNRMPTYKTVITLAHEFGHNFGSPHDSNTDLSCSPGGDYGNYLMYPYATAGSLPNNRVFSPCSIGYIFPVIRNKASCFMSSNDVRSICGNGIIEDGEDCDCGSSDTCADIDPCCTPSDIDPSSSDQPCKIQTSQGSECSPLSSPCCNDNCKVISQGNLQQCMVARDCTESQFCDGLSAECPGVENKSNGTECDGGTKTCMEGSCTGSICAIHGGTPCVCSGEYNCYMCCQSSGSSVCQPTVNHAGQMIHRLLGQSCEDRHGYCDGQGTCILKDSSNTLDSIHEVFTKESVEGFKQLLELYWYYWVAAIGALAFMISVFVLTCRDDSNVHTSAYMHGQFGRIQREAEIQKQYLIRRKGETKAFYEEQLRNPDSSREMCVTTAIARLMAFFPTAPKDVIMQTLETSINEEAAVRWMLLRNYPFRRVCNQKELDKQAKGTLFN